LYSQSPSLTSFHFSLLIKLNVTARTGFDWTPQSHKPFLLPQVVAIEGR
jgi:hypothetical protein